MIVATRDSSDKLEKQLLGELLRHTEKRTLTYNMGCEGHLDLIMGMPCKGHMRTHHARVQLVVSSSYSLCYVYRQTDRQTV